MKDDRLVDEIVSRFETHRARLFGLAYRMMGSRVDAEDLLQDAWLRFAEAAHGDIASDGAFLSTLVTRLCLDRMKSARARRESYVGPWLPEPIRKEPDTTLAADDKLGQAESVSFALLLALEALSPLERAVFILREVFDFPFEEIAAMVETSASACRQLLHRAHEHVRAHRPRFRPSRDQQTRLATAFFGAVQRGDVAALAELLTEDAVVTSDGGGRVATARKEVHGRDNAARLLVGLANKAAADLVPEPAWLNGCVGIVFRRAGQAEGAVLLESDGACVWAIRFVFNPDKLRSIDVPLPAATELPR